MKLKNSWDYLQPDFYRFDQDSLELARCAVELTETFTKGVLLDAGAGGGVVGLEVYQKSPKRWKKLIFIEKQKVFEKYLRVNSREVIEQDEALELEFIFSALEHQDGLEDVDLLICNPPYFRSDKSRASQDQRRAQCRSWGQIEERAFFKKALSLLRAKRGVGLCSYRDDLNSLLTPLGGQATVYKDLGATKIYHFFEVLN